MATTDIIDISKADDSAELIEAVEDLVGRFCNIENQPYGFTCAYAVIRAAEGVLHRDDILAQRKRVTAIVKAYEENCIVEIAV